MNLKNMPVIILAAGASSRFWPLSNKKHKTMFSLMGRPILDYVLRDLARAGIKKTILVLSPRDEKQIKPYFKKGEKLGLSIEYALQRKALGQANAILSAKNKINSKDFFVINAYHLNSSIFLKDLIKNKKSEKADLLLLGKKTNRPWQYGIFKLKGKRAVDIIEKPQKGKEPSNIRNVGIYYLNHHFLNLLQKQPTEEYQLESTLAKFMQKNRVLVFKTERETTSLKYAWDLLKFKNYLLFLKFNYFN